MKKEIRQWIYTIIFTIIISFTIKTYVFARSMVDGPSMLPTLQNNNSLFTENLSPLMGNIKRGEIITFDSENINHNIYVKRVIGVAGDTIELIDGKVYLNGNELDEPYLKKNTITKGGTFLKENQKITIQKGYIFVLGDNREVSNDSRYFGPVSIKAVKGHVILRIYPFNEIRSFK